MKIAILTLLSGLLISLVGEYFSILGLMAIFSAAPWSVAAMAAALGIGKLVASVWLKQNWNTAPFLLKSYITFAVCVLMFITALGCFGFLSKAHSDQNLVSSSISTKLDIYDQRIKTAKENIEADRTALKQMDSAVDQAIARTDDLRGTNRAVSIRRSQRAERARLTADIEAQQKIIEKASAESEPLRIESKKVEAEVGPIKYIAQMVYGENPDANLLEKAVSWIIILIVIVFDPLAVSLLLASQFTLQKIKEESQDTFSQAFHDVKGSADPDLDLNNPEEVFDVDDSDESDNEMVEDTNEPELSPDDLMAATINKEEIELARKAAEIAAHAAAHAAADTNAVNTLKTHVASEINAATHAKTAESAEVSGQNTETQIEFDFDAPPNLFEVEFIHLEDETIVKDSAGTTTIRPLDVQVIDRDYLKVDGVTYYHKALQNDSDNAFDVANRLNDTSYIQNEEQNESSIWSRLNNRNRERNV